MLSIYTVQKLNGEKIRRHIETVESMEEAKHICNCHTLGYADYAYVKDTMGGTVFYLKKPEDYYEAEPQTIFRDLPILPSPEQ